MAPVAEAARKATASGRQPASRKCVNVMPSPTAAMPQISSISDACRVNSRKLRHAGPSTQASPIVRTPTSRMNAITNQGSALRRSPFGRA